MKLSSKFLSMFFAIICCCSSYGSDISLLDTLLGTYIGELSTEHADTAKVKVLLMFQKHDDGICMSCYNIAVLKSSGSSKAKAFIYDRLSNDESSKFFTNKVSIKLQNGSIEDRVVFQVKKG